MVRRSPAGQGRRRPPAAGGPPAQAASPAAADGPHLTVRAAGRLGVLTAAPAARDRLELAGCQRTRVEPACGTRGNSCRYRRIGAPSFFLGAQHCATTAVRVGPGLGPGATGWSGCSRRRQAWSCCGAAPKDTPDDAHLAAPTGHAAASTTSTDLTGHMGVAQPLCAGRPDRPPP